MTTEIYRFHIKIVDFILFLCFNYYMFIAQAETAVKKARHSLRSDPHLRAANQIIRYSPVCEEIQEHQ